MPESMQTMIKRAQQSELTEYIIYKKLAAATNDTHNRTVLESIANDELKHHDFWKSVTQQTVSCRRTLVLWYVFLARFFGLTFAVKLMERGEGLAQGFYEKMRGEIQEVEGIINDENDHESQLLGLINEERLAYVSSMVLGLNDALVELTGALVGLTLALQKTRLVAIVGLITGIAAAMSMSASAYLSVKHEDTSKSPFKASAYTGLAYIITVIALILPYFFFDDVFVCLLAMIGVALGVILVFTFYISVAKDMSFKKRFLEMAGISMGIAAINFLVGLVVRRVFGIDS